MPYANAVCHASNHQVSEFHGCEAGADTINLSSDRSAAIFLKPSGTSRLLVAWLFSEMDRDHFLESMGVLGDFC